MTREPLPAPEPAEDEAGSTESAAEVVVRLGKALHVSGSPAHRIEEGMELAARRLGLDGHFFSTPTALFASFRHRSHRSTVLERVDPAEIHLRRLDVLDELLEGIATGRLGVAEVSRRLDPLFEEPVPYRGLPTVLAFGLVSAAAALFFRGGWPEIVAAGGVGLLIGGLSQLAPRLPALNRLFEPVAAFVAAFVAYVAAGVWGWADPSVVVLSGLIVLIPGLTLTVAFTELATRHLVSGSARLAGAVVLFFTLAFGVGLGSLLARMAAGVVPETVPDPLGGSWKWLAVAVAATGFVVLFRARARDAAWILLAGALAIQAVDLGSAALGPQLGAFVGALTVGVAGNLFARLLHRPAALLQVPGLILLVPGSLGFRSLTQLMSQDVLSGLETAFDTTLVGIALATGLLLANVVIPPRRVL
jgi:uncharacterized membrane protein YjjP (DUF1212 family)